MVSTWPTQGSQPETSRSQGECLFTFSDPDGMPCGRAEATSIVIRSKERRYRLVAIIRYHRSVAITRYHCSVAIIRYQRLRRLFGINDGGDQSVSTIVVYVVAGQALRRLRGLPLHRRHLVQST